MIWQDLIGAGGLLVAAVGLVFAFCKYFSDRRDRQQEKLEARFMERMDQDKAEIFKRMDQDKAEIFKRMDQDKAEIFKRIDKSDDRNEKQFECVNGQLRDLNRRVGVVEGAVIGVQVLHREPRTMAAQSVPDQKEPRRPEE